MTIAAGFKFHDGILLCADTQHTYSGVMKLQERKIRDVTFHNGGSKAAFVLSGSVSYGNMAIDHCISKAEKIKTRNMTAAGFRLSVEECLEDFHKKHIYVHPEFRRDGGPDFSLLIVFWSHMDKTASLFSTADSAVNEVKMSQCIGAGSYLGQYIIRKIYRHPRMDIQHVVNIAIHMLRLTKEHVDSCGGNSDIYVVRKNGDSSLHHFDISVTENISNVFEMAINNVFLTAANLDASEDELSKEFDRAKQMLMATVKRHRKDKADWEKFMGAISGLNQAPK